MKSLGGYLSAHKKRMAVGLTIKSFGTVAELFLPMIMAYMIDDVAPTGSVLQLSLWGVAMLAFAVIAWGGNVIANRMASRVARDTTEVIRNDLFTSTLYLSARQTDKVTVPSLVSRLSSDTYNVHNMIGMIQRLGVRVPILLVGGVALTFSVEPVLALVLLAVVPFLTVVVIFVSSKGITLYTDLQRAVDTMVRKVRDDYTGIRVIKALSRTEYEKQGFAKINENVVGKETKAGVIMSVTNPIMNVVLNLGMTVVVLVGAIRVSKGLAQVGEIIAFTSYFTIILNAVISISRIFVNVSKGSASSKRICAVLNMPDELIKDETLAKAEEGEKSGAVKFENVTFSYDGAPALKNVSFELKKGESLGVIGATGSGKTTLVALLLRFYDCDKGRILVDGINVKGYDEKELREKFGVVLQNDFLMAASVKDNIKFEREIDDKDMKEAASRAKAAPFVEALENGYDSMLTVRGANFSGGQKQRLLIARALAGDPEILVLDDSSSALDYKTDAALRATLRENYPDTTIIMIAQRISSVRFADKILVLDKGEAVGLGDDETLMKTCEVYRRIYESQGEGGGGND